MNNKLSVLVFLLFLSAVPSAAQSSAVSPAGSLDIRRLSKPPIFKVDPAEDIVFEDPNRNNCIDAGETCYIYMDVENVGLGKGTGLTARIDVSGNVGGLETEAVRRVADIGVGRRERIAFRITAGMDTEDGMAEFRVKLHEPEGFGTETYVMQVRTNAFRPPLVQVSDYSVTSASGMDRLVKYSPFELQVLLQNVDIGEAEDVRVSMVLPEGVVRIDNGAAAEYVGSLKPGEQYRVEYGLIIANDYAGTEVPLHIDIREKNGYAVEKDIVLHLDQVMADNKVDITPIAPDPVGEITVASLRSDVDVAVPDTDAEYGNRFALIIGNELYHDYQKGLASEADVEYAANDAWSFREYCISALGVREDNVFICTNVTSAVMHREIDKVSRLVELKGKDAELIFFYAGHGFPDEKTGEPYLVPVDVSASYVAESGVSLYGLCDRFARTGASRVTLFVDACFSGGGRNAGLVNMRGSIRVVEKSGGLNGNVVMFSASDSDQTALPYDEKKHGMFTYFLLKFLQETNAAGNYSELSDYLKEHVYEYGIRENDKTQVPQTSVSPSVTDEWETWTFMD